MEKLNAIYPLTADPIHNEHLDIIRKASKMFEKLTIAIGVNEEKTPLFTLEERIEMIKNCTHDLLNVNVTSFDGLLSQFALMNDIKYIIRGIRDEKDLNYEILVDELLELEKFNIEIICFLGRKNISSSAIKALQIHGGNLSEHVPAFVKYNLERKISDKCIIGVTGLAGSGKNYICEKLRKLISDRIGPTRIHTIDFDDLAHRIQKYCVGEPFISARRKIIDKFGWDLHDISENIEEYYINTSLLSKIIFHDDFDQESSTLKLSHSKNALESLMDILRIPTMTLYYNMLRHLTGIILLNCPYLVEANLLDLCNNNVILVQAKENTRFERMYEKGWTSKKICGIYGSQKTDIEKMDIINSEIISENFGNLILLQNDEESDLEPIVERIFDIAQVSKN